MMRLVDREVKEMNLDRLKETVQKMLPEKYDIMIVIGDKGNKQIRFLEKCENIKIPPIYNEKYLERCNFNVEKIFQDKKVLMFVDVVDFNIQFYKYYNMLIKKFKVPKSNIKVRVYGETIGIEEEELSINDDSKNYCLNGLGFDTYAQMFMEEILLCDKYVLPAEKDLLYYEAEIPVAKWNKLKEDLKRIFKFNEFYFGREKHYFGYFEIEREGGLIRWHKDRFLLASVIKYNYIVLDDYIKIVFVPYNVHTRYYKDIIKKLYDNIFNELMFERIDEETYITMNDAIMTVLNCYSGKKLEKFMNTRGITIKRNDSNIRSSWEKEFWRKFDSLLKDDGDLLLKYRNDIILNGDKYLVDEFPRCKEGRIRIVSSAENFEALVIEQAVKRMILYSKGEVKYKLLFIEIEDMIDKWYAGSDYCKSTSLLDAIVYQTEFFRIKFEYVTSREFILTSVIPRKNGVFMALLNFGIDYLLNRVEY